MYKIFSKFSKDIRDNAGVLADLEPPRIRPPVQHPLADIEPRWLLIFWQIWTPLTDLDPHVKTYAAK